jgi:hypothetical protein
MPRAACAPADPTVTSVREWFRGGIVTKRSATRGTASRIDGPSQYFPWRL